MSPTNDDRDMLIRIDERTSNLADDIGDLKANYVTRAEFAPVRALVFGAVALVLIGFMGALIIISGIQR